MSFQLDFEPLSECKMIGASNSQKIWYNWLATSSPPFVVHGLKWQNLVKRSWQLKICRQGGSCKLSDKEEISTKSICLLSYIQAKIFDVL